MTMRVAALYRYPVKAMAGEQLEAVEFDARGITGDRWYAVEDAEGHFASGKNTTRFRRHNEIFGYRAWTSADGVRVASAAGEWAIGDPALDADLSRHMGTAMTVRAEREVDHFDDGPVSLIGTATLKWCAEEFGIDADVRRLRCNIVVETGEPFVEEGWVGQEISMGNARLRVEARLERCRMIDVEQVGVPADGRWLKPLGEHRDTRLAVYAFVVAPGQVTVGDLVRPLGQ